jgi:hypothetical protein
LENKQPKYIAKKLKYGTMSTVIIIIVIAVVVVLNIIVSMLTDRGALKIDLTPNKIYGISSETEEYIKTIDKEVKIIVCGKKTEMLDSLSYSYIVNILDKFPTYNDKVSVDYVNVVDEPEKVSKYINMYNGATAISDGALIVTSGDKIRVNRVDDLFQKQADEQTYYATGQLVYSITGLNVEAVIVPNMLYVTNANPVRVALIASNVPTPAQYSLSNFYQILYDNAYEIETVVTEDGREVYRTFDLALEDIDPEKYDLAIVSAPIADFSSTVIDKLSNFMNNGGNYGKQLLYLADINQPTLPNIDAFLATWGLKVEYSMMMETVAERTQNVQLLISSEPQISPSPIGAVVSEDYVVDNTNYIVLPGCRPVTQLWSENDNYVTSAILQSSDTVKAGSITEDTTNGDDTLKARNAVALSTRTFQSTKTFSELKSKVMVFGTSHLANYYVTSNKSYANNDFIINSIDTLVGKENNTDFAFVPKSLTEEPITTTETEVNIVRNILLIFVPAIVVFGGVIVYLKRRNR